MSTKLLFKITLLISFFVMNIGYSQEETMLVAGSGNKNISMITKKGDILWSHSLEKGEECNSISILENGDILYSFKKGAKIIDKEHNVKWEYIGSEAGEVQLAMQLENGDILIGQCSSPSKILEFSREGILKKEVTFDLQIKKAHGQFRKITKTIAGTYLIPVMSKGCVIEINEDGKLLKTLKTGGNPFSVCVLKNNNWLISLGDAHKLIEVNPKTDEIVWEVNQEDIVGAPLNFVAQLIRLENGNTIICNWLGHLKGSTKIYPSLIEINTDKKLIWSLKKNDKVGKISTLDPKTDLKYWR